jgi:twinkle protein
MNDRDEIKERIKSSVDLADWVRRDGIQLTGGPNEFKAKCPFHDDSTPSFTVFRKDGSWAFHCFGCAASGDIYEWVMRRKGIAFPEALKLVANDANIALPSSGARLYQPAEVRAAASAEQFAQERERGPFDPEKFRPLNPEGKVAKYLTEKRKLPLELLVDYSVGETADGEAYSFAYKWRPPYWPASRPRPLFEFCKVVKVDRPDGKKIEWREPKGGKNILFGMVSPRVLEEHEKHGELVICEGEIDAITWAAYGYAAVSVPGGAKYLGWIDLCWDWLENFSKIHISFDEDAAGRMKVMEIVTRLGIVRTDMVRLKHKDINECLQAGVSREEIQACVAQAEGIRPEKLKGIMDFGDEIWRKFHPDGTEQLGLLLPWGNHFGSSLPFRFRYGEVTVWTGYNKHGKSEVLNHCIVDLCWQGEKALICSLEVQAPETYRKIIRMSQGRRDVCAVEERELFAERCLRPLADKVWVYDVVGTAALEDVLNVMLYAYQRYGVRQFVLDSLMRFEGLDGEGQDIWNSQKEFMGRLLHFAQLNNVHIHLVAHSKKPKTGGDSVRPQRYDIQGSAYISNLAFNVIVVWRNRKKQDELEELFQKVEQVWVQKNRDSKQKMPQFKRLLGGKPPKEAPPEHLTHWNYMIDYLEMLPVEDKDRFLELVKDHDSYLCVDAQRGGEGDTPVRQLWFHYDSLQFLEVSPWENGDSRRKPVVYVARKQAEMDEAF